MYQIKLYICISYQTPKFVILNLVGKKEEERSHEKKKKNESAI